MMQIRAGGQRINDFVGEPVGQELVQPRAELFPAQRLSSWATPFTRNSSFAWRARPNRETSSTTRPGDCSATRTTRRTKLCRAPQRCSSAASPCERTSYCRPPRAASHSPFSRTSAGPAVHTVARARSSSAASSMRADYRRLQTGNHVAELRSWPERVRAENCGLIESEPGDADRRIHVVPLRGDVLVPNLKIALLSRGEGRIVFCEQTLLVAQHHLVERIVKFERDFNLLDAPVATVLERPEHKCYFLVQKIGRAAHFRF